MYYIYIYLYTYNIKSPTTDTLPPEIRKRSMHKILLKRNNGKGPFRKGLIWNTEKPEKETTENKTVLKRKHRKKDISEEETYLRKDSAKQANLKQYT